MAGAAAAAVAGAPETIDGGTIGEVAPIADVLGTDEACGLSAAAARADALDSLRVIDDAPVALDVREADAEDAVATGVSAGAAVDETDTLDVTEDDFIGSPATEFVDGGDMAPVDGIAPTDTAGAFVGAR